MNEKRILGAVGLLVALGLSLSGCVQPVGPLARFSATPEFGYPPLNTTLDASGSSSPNGAIVRYDWDFGDGETGTGTVVTHTYPEKGVYPITLMVTDAAGKTAARSLSVEALNRAPVARFTFSPYWVYVNVEATFDASESSDPDGEIVEYRWSFGDGSTGEGQVVEHAFPYSATGGAWVATVTLTVVDDNGKTATTSKNINVQGCSSCGG